MPEAIDQGIRRDHLIKALQDIQSEKGYLSRKDMEAVEKETRVPLVEVYGVATFYSEFKLNPPGKHKIKVCEGTACHVNKAKDLIEHLCEKLDVEVGETTKDGMYSLESVNCIGACAKAPAVMIDGEVHGNLTPEKLKEVLEGYG